jgi:hypothetical protein
MWWDESRLTGFLGKLGHCLKPANGLQSLRAMPTIAERLKELESVDDAGLMTGYRFLVTPRRKRSGTKVMFKNAVAKKYKASGSSHKLVPKSVCKTS